MEEKLKLEREEEEKLRKEKADEEEKNKVVPEMKDLGNISGIDGGADGGNIVGIDGGIDGGDNMEGEDFEDENM